MFRPSFRVLPRSHVKHTARDERNTPRRCASHQNEGIIDKHVNTNPQPPRRQIDEKSLELGLLKGKARQCMLPSVRDLTGGGGQQSQRAPWTSSSRARLIVHPTAIRLVFSEDHHRLQNRVNPINGSIALIYVSQTTSVMIK